jgi:arginine/lysine/ornithine decarboxylase
MFTEGVDLPEPGSSDPSPLQQAMALAAEAWGARRTWFLTNGASQGNHVACLALRALGSTTVVQRSVHTSVIDGAILAGLRLEFVLPSIDPALGIAHGVTAADLEAQLGAHPDAVAAYVVTPSYFGACADVVALAKVAHDRGIPLVVDEAWGSHFGFHPELPRSALQSGADLVISSTHKLGGSLTQSAMLHLADGPYADLLEPLIQRAMTTVQTTSPSALLFASLDLARRDLQLNGIEGIGASIADLERARALLNERGRFVDPDPSIHAAPDVIALDPLRIVVDTRSGGTPGYVARRLLEERNLIHVEMATDSCIVGLVGAGCPARHAGDGPRPASRHPFAAPQHAGHGPARGLLQPDRVRARGRGGRPHLRGFARRLSARRAQYPPGRGPNPADHRLPQVHGRISLRLGARQP